MKYLFVFSLVYGIMFTGKKNGVEVEPEPEPVIEIESLSAHLQLLHALLKVNHTPGYILMQTDLNLYIPFNANMLFKVK